LDFVQTLAPELSARLKHAIRVASLLDVVDPALRFDLLFHSAFAAKLFKVMQRPESRNEGFDRMQQSFKESVEKVREIVRTSSFSEAASVTELSAQGMARLLDLINDLALVKQWEVEHE
jgi:hypothetical protein